MNLLEGFPVVYLFDGEQRSVPFSSANIASPFLGCSCDGVVFKSGLAFSLAHDVPLRQAVRKTHSPLQAAEQESFNAEAVNAMALKSISEVAKSSSKLESAA